MGVADYAELKRVKQLCQDRYKPVAYAGELSRVKEIQARHWCLVAGSGYMDYQYPRSEYLNYTGHTSNRVGLRTGLQSLESAMKELMRKQEAPVKYIIIAKM